MSTLRPDPPEPYDTRVEKLVAMDYLEFGPELDQQSHLQQNTTTKVNGDFKVF